MATLDQFKDFAKTHKTDKSGIYIIQPKNNATMPIKIGYSYNLASRFRSYQHSLPAGFEVLGVGLVRNAIQAENFMKYFLSPYVQSGKEWIDPKFKSKILNTWAMAHKNFADGYQGQQLFTASDIISKRLPTSYEILPESRVTTESTPAKIALTTIPRAPRLKKPDTGHLFDKKGLRRSIRIAAKVKQ